ncbi:DUF2264 domain-containing protein [Paenibacillus psychroresistens]|uniref:DUF2264 domain-containing protein n=1 Tax=Paenibacillus psychroresistens TaxID=1778678 RepID=A0A6B8RHB0_9BACL|nr:DUF2264 domain-containing protein [Paenibacillus psychroresistens]QGQ95114.1 DUF2264 domain-containing protein [Paenibacillus psychroresistens]
MIANQEGIVDRSYWIETLIRIVRPVLYALRDKKLKQLMSNQGETTDRSPYMHLEALGRTLCGIAPWLECIGCEEEEEVQRIAYAELARQAIDAGTDPDSPDFMNFKNGSQPLVDAAFLAHALLRAPNELMSKLEPHVRRNLIAALSSTRTIKPMFNNWLLFSAMVEAALYRLGEEFDSMRVDYAIRQHEQWYMGDGAYGDGASFHWDYYNSFVIQPMLVDVLNVFGDKDEAWGKIRKLVLSRAIRYADVQERLISPEGTFPPIGRSLVYRFGAFQHLAQMSLQQLLPNHLKPGQVRSGLSAVIRRMMQVSDNFDTNGWLTIGFCGFQPNIGEHYISTGSLYLCTTVFLPLGLPVSDPFWAEPFTAWTSLNAWSGNYFPIDCAL